MSLGAGTTFKSPEFEGFAGVAELDPSSNFVLTPSGTKVGAAFCAGGAEKTGGLESADPAGVFLTDVAVDEVAVVVVEEVALLVVTGGF